MSQGQELDRGRRLRRAVDDLPRELRPKRDLWPGIAGRLEARPRRAPGGGWWRLAAAVAVTAGGLLMAVALRPAAPTAGRAVAARASGGSAAMTAPELRQRDGAMHAHRDLVTVIARRGARLEPAAAGALADGLAELERATAEIAAALDEHPRARSLQLALAAAYRRESEWAARLGRV